MVKYQKKFLREIKSLLPYFIEFKKDGTIISKEYLDDYIVEGPNWQLIIMIVYDENTFSVNHNCQKIWTLKNHTIFCLKEKKKILRY